MKTVSAEGCGLSVDVLDRIRGVLAKCSRLELAVLYGSRAKGTHRAASDIDLALMGERLTHDDLLGLDTALDDLLLPYKIDLALLHAIDTPALREHIERVGRALYEKTRQSCTLPEADGRCLGSPRRPHGV